MRLAGIDADVAAAGAFPLEYLRQFLGVGEGLPENQPAPTQVEHHVLGHRVDQVLRGRVVQAKGDGFGMVLAGIGGFDVVGRPVPAVTRLVP